ncbi:hypothetical protein ACO2Q2_13085 [Dyella sp. KRB-257]|uniref:hypothetical protein n=1 Tax=Dyella sp. KRB-257 TaxID=3400915 RepID=UPI003C064110
MAIYFDSIPFVILLTAVVMLSIIGVGVACFLAITGKSSNLNGVEVLAYGIACGVGIHACMGIITVCLPWSYQFNAAATLIACNISAWIYLWRVKIFSVLSTGGWFLTNILIAAWVFIVAVCLLITYAPIKFPNTLVDGPYVIKNHDLHVKIQVITGNLPADNYIPYLAEQYLLRDIQFSEERPLMPGQELSNRPILMSLVALPFGASFDPPPKQYGKLPKFTYVGTLWPDVGRLGSDRYFRSFLVVGIVLNAMLVVAAGLLFASFGLSNVYLVVGLILLIINPYVISQVLFTWPKEMAAFFLLMATHAIRFRRNLVLAGILSALGYLSHPYAIVFAFSYAVYLFLSGSDISVRIKKVVTFGVSFVLVVAPWFIWSRIILAIPSDLIAQNFDSSASIVDLLWVRLHNGYIATFPSFFQDYPLLANQFVQENLVSLPGAVGLFFIWAAYAGCFYYARSLRFLIFFGIVIPGALLIGVFSSPAVPVLMGFQAIAPVLLLLSLKWMQDRLKFRWLIICFAFQVSTSVAMIVARASSLGL